MARCVDSHTSVGTKIPGPVNVAQKVEVPCAVLHVYFLLEWSPAPCEVFVSSCENDVSKRSQQADLGWWLAVLRIALIAFIFGSAGLCAQSDEIGVGEIGVYAGTMVGPLSGNTTVGGHFGGAFSRYAIGLIDTAYTPIGTRILAIIPSNVTTSSSNLYDFNFGFHIRVPVGKRWAPYGIMSAALVYNRYEAIAILPDDSISHSVQSISRSIGDRN